MVIRVTPTETLPTHHISLSDGVTTLGLIAVTQTKDGQLEPMINAIRRQPYTRSNLVVNQGRGQLSEMRPPYGEFTQSAFPGGIGSRRAADDATRCWWAERVFTCSPDYFCNSPWLRQAKLPGMVGNLDYKTPVTFPAGATLAAGEAIGVKVTPAAQLSLVAPGLYLAGSGNAKVTYTVTIRSDVAGSVGAILGTATGTLRLGVHHYTPFIQLTLAAATSYWLVIEADGPMKVGVVAGQSESIAAEKKYSGGVWTDAAINTYFYLADNGLADLRFFEYRGALLAVSGGARLFLNGDWGACDSNAGQTNKVIDVTKAWTVDQWVGATVVMMEGSVALQARQVIANDATSLTLSSPFGLPLTTAMSYLITATSEWQEITGHGLTAGQVVGVGVTNENVIYFAQGSGTTVRGARFYNNAGVWTAEYANEAGSVADCLLFAWDQEDKSVLWKAWTDGAKAYVAKAPCVPWNTALTFGEAITIGDWSPVRGLAIWDGKLAVLKGNGVWLVLNDVPEKLSIDFTGYDQWLTGINPSIVSPYLVFPYGGGLQRLLNQLVEDFGPALGRLFVGEYYATQALPGGMLATIRGKYQSSGENSLLLYRGGGWHNLASIGTVPLAGQTRFQRNPNRNAPDRIWFGTQSGMWWMDFPNRFDPLKDYFASSFSFGPGSLITGWYDIDNRRLDKWWETIYVQSGVGTVDVYCQVETQAVEDTAGATYPDLSGDWTYLGQLVNESKSLAIRLKSKQIRFMFLFEPGAGKVDGFNVEYLSRIDDTDTAAAHQLRCGDEHGPRPGTL